jgi:uncharacterized protein
MKLIQFARQEIAGVSFSPAPERIVSGAPAQTVWNHYTDPTERFYAGIWQGEPGAWRVVYAPHEEEFCVLLEGRVRIAGDDGSEHLIEAGDAFVVPGGFTGVWENLTRVRKHYAIMQLKENDHECA